MIVTQTPTLKVGLGGNHYVVCETDRPLHSICMQIGKSVNSIYYNKKYSCYAIRVKNQKQKRLLKEILS